MDFNGKQCRNTNGQGRQDTSQKQDLASGRTWRPWASCRGRKWTIWRSTANTACTSLASRQRTRGARLSTASGSSIKSWANNIKSTTGNLIKEGVQGVAD